MRSNLLGSLATTKSLLTTEQQLVWLDWQPCLSFDCYDVIKCITKNIGGWSLSCYTLVLVFPRYVCGAFELLISRWATLGNIGQDRVMLILELRWPCGRGITSSRCLNFFTTKAGRSRGAGSALQILQLHNSCWALCCKFRWRQINIDRSVLNNCIKMHMTRDSLLFLMNEKCYCRGRIWPMNTWTPVFYRFPPIIFISKTDSTHISFIFIESPLILVKCPGP